MTLLVPEDKKNLLNTKIYVYSLPDKTFVPTEEEETGLTYHSVESVKPIKCECFPSVFKAMSDFGGVIKFI